MKFQEFCNEFEEEHKEKFCYKKVRQEFFNYCMEKYSEWCKKNSVTPRH